MIGQGSTDCLMMLGGLGFFLVHTTLVRALQSVRAGAPLHGNFSSTCGTMVLREECKCAVSTGKPHVFKRACKVQINMHEK